MSTATVPSDVNTDVTVDALLDERDAVAIAELKLLAIRIIEGEKVSGARLNAALFAANMSRQEFKDHLRQIRSRRAGAAELARANELDADYQAYQGSARALVSEYMAMAEHYERCYIEANRAAEFVRGQLAARFDEAASVRQRAMLALRVRRGRTTEQELRNLSRPALALEDRLRSLESARSGFTAERRLAMEGELDSLRRAVEESRVRDYGGEYKRLSREFAQKKKEFDALCNLEAEHQSATAELARVRELMREVSTRQNDWQDYDFDRPPRETGSPLPAANIDPTGEMIAGADGLGRPVIRPATLSDGRF